MGPEKQVLGACRAAPVVRLSGGDDLGNVTAAKPEG
jgi:hypothetical protein